MPAQVQAVTLGQGFVVVGDDPLAIIEWVRQMRGANPPKMTPVLFRSAYYKHAKGLIEALEATEILAKPFGFEELAHSIRRLLGRAR